MLTGITLENFKAFKEPQFIPIKPITLIFGSNSAGKSSLLHSLLWLNHVESRGETDVFNPALSGQSINLGGFDSCRNRNSEKDYLKFSLTIDNPHLNPDVEKWTDSISQFKMTFVFRRLGKNQSPCLQMFRLHGDDIELLTAWMRKGGQIGTFSSKINFDHPAMPFASGITEDINERLNSINTYGGYDLLGAGFLPRRMELDHFQKIIVENPNSHLDVNKFLPFIIQELPSAVISVFEDLSKTIREIQYLPPLRAIPDRSMDIRSCELPGWSSLGKRPELLNKVNATLKLLKFEHRLQLRKQIPADGLEKVFSEFVSQAEAGRNLGALSDAMQAAREEWENLGHKEKRIWLENHPEFFQEMITAGREMTDEDWSGYFEENPDKSDEEGDQPSDEWLQKEAVRLAWNFLDDWSNDGTHARFYNDAFRLHVSEDPNVRAAMAEAFSEQHMKDLIDSKVERIEPRLHNSKNDLWVALQDVGVGASQVIPIVIEAHSQKEKLIAIEQPELHLHPALQAELGDVFIESALGENKNKFLLETHSEHLILRILRRIRESTEGEMDDWPDELRKACPNGIRPEDISVLYVEPPLEGSNEGSTVIELPITPNGDFDRRWPDGFFEERANELF